MHMQHTTLTAMPCSRHAPAPQAEIKRRAESDKQLQSHFEGEIRAVAERTAAQHADMQNALKQAIDSLSNRVQDLHTIVRQVYYALTPQRVVETAHCQLPGTLQKWPAIIMMPATSWLLQLDVAHANLAHARL